LTYDEFEVLNARINEELNNVSALERELQNRNLWETKKMTLLPVDTDDSFILRAIGSILHDFYVAVENIFEMIAREVDGAVPRDPEWHFSLLKQMAAPLPTHRPVIIQRATLEILNEFRAFRHIFRNVYGFSLSAAKLKLLVDELPAAISALKKDLDLFLTKMNEIVNKQ
jgi:hypothetical protein